MLLKQCCFNFNTVVEIAPETNQTHIYGEIVISCLRYHLYIQLTQIKIISNY